MWERQAAANDFKNVLATTADEIKQRIVIYAALKDEKIRRLGLERRDVDPAQMIEAGPDLTAELEARDERVREIEQMVKDQPEEMATLLRGWLAADSR